ncbi:hypothetical protein Rsub_03259 [Raphidocelis subcapitata]|uniref:CHRD domain-containing protein n=1 Tax=Raphidocelis subcapitata TaxID=307507 RepID=A0A2V0NR49_9CHLO|nr:hypothetical protein Rsub_03259 [Raphidocelis subcapitata]|eukprot:GBF90126.1 hypothetical protein Rsub_03259 [Raphidocelis subcapitata]
MRTSHGHRAVGAAAVLLAAALLVQSASAAKCAVKALVSGKEPSPGKGKFKGSFCWDGDVLGGGLLKATLTWSVSTVTKYRGSVLGNFTTLATIEETSPMVAKLTPPIGYVKKIEGTATVAELIAGGVLPDALAFGKLLCSGDAGVGIVAEDSSGLMKVIASAKLPVPKSAAETCALLSPP